MAYYDNRVLFSPKGDYFAYASADGCLKIWETASNVLKQEYIPSSHLSSTCSSLAWGPCQHSALRSKKAKKSNISMAIADLNLIAMGTLSGEILLYSVMNGDLHAKLTGGHTDVVNGISWFAEEDSLFTCSSDQHIIRWCVSEGQMKVKWKAEKSAVYSVCVVDASSLLSAGSSIVWWDMKKQTKLKTFTGHATEVFCLLPIRLEDSSAKYNYFLSSASGDRVVSVWHLTEDSDSDNAVASFTLPDEPTALDISGNSIKAEPIKVSIVTKNGMLSIFEHHLNGRMKKPISPKSTVQIASMASKSEKKSQPIPILATKFAGNINSCMVAYGNFLKPVFEMMDLDTFQLETYLIRENRSSAIALEGISKIKQPERPSNTKHLAPGYMTAPKTAESLPRKKKRKDNSVSELPMEERLNAMYLGQTPEDTVPETAPNPDSMVHLLLQGLQSKDNKLLSSVFRCSEESLIRNTVKKLPLNSIPLLLPVLHERLTKRGNRPCLRWLKCVLSIHLSYLMSLQEIDQYIGPVSQLIEAREETFPRMSHFVGFMGVLLSQIECQSENNAYISEKPSVIYQNESSSEDEEQEENEEMEHDAAEQSHSESSSEDEELHLSSDEMENQ